MKQRRQALLLLAALAVITFLDRISIASAGPRIQADLHISAEQWGWVLGAFILAYGLFEVPTGAMGDRKGPQGVLTRIVLWWSAFTALTGAASGFAPLVTIRFLFGAGEAGAYPNMAGVVARWFPAAERAQAQGFIWAASRFGGALAPLLVVPLQMWIGWRWTFVVFGFIGVAWTIAWRTWWRNLRAGDPSGGAATGKVAPAHSRTPWSELFRQPQLWLIFVMYFCYAWGSWFFFGWFPTWLVKGAGFSEAEMGIYSALPFLLGTAGNIAGGFLSDRMVASFGLKRARRLVGCGSLVISSLLLIGMTLTHQRAAVVTLSSLGFGVADLMLPTAWALCLDIGGEHAGVVTGVMNSAGQFGGFVCAIVFGYVVQATGNYNVPLWGVAGMVMLAALLFTRIDASRPLFGRALHTSAQH
ncbi:MAG TPA: MFS transporter [Bryobacteraceae bacterium]|nr:MFS transporter [Bryobacteraceae bacterium]